MFGRAVNAFCFWLLTALAFVLFFLAVIRPPERQYRAHAQIEKAMDDSVQQLRDRVDRNENTIARLNPKDPDPRLVQRLGEEMLGMEIPGGRVLDTRLPAVRMSDDAAAAAEAQDPANQDSPWYLTDPVANWEHFKKLDNQQVQRLELLMSGVAISMALIFFGTPTKLPRRRTRDEEDGDDEQAEEDAS